MVVAIAVSLTMFGAVLLAWAAAGRETEAAYASTEPASATILLDRPHRRRHAGRDRRDGPARPGVIAATGRTQFHSEASVNGQPRKIPVQIFVAPPDDPMRMARCSQSAGVAAAPDEIFLVRDASSLLGAAVGDTVTVEPAQAAQPSTLRVADTVYDPSLSPSPQEQTARGYLSTALWPPLGRPTQLDQLKLQIADPGKTTPSRDRDAVVAIAGQVGQWLQGDHGLTIREIQVPPPYRIPTNGRPTRCWRAAGRRGGRRCCCPRSWSPHAATTFSPSRSRRSAS